MTEETLKELREIQRKLKTEYKTVSGRLDYLKEFGDALNDALVDLDLLLGFESEDKWKHL